MSSPTLSDPVFLQENEYSFPYHYVAQYSPHFTHCYCDSWGIHYVSTLEFLLERVEAEVFSSLVDIGCGDGRLTQELAARFPEKMIQGIDSSRRAINLAQAMNRSSAEFLCMDITSNPVARRYDIAMLIEVYEHIPPERAKTFLQALAVLLAPNGILFLTVPHANKPLEAKHFRHFTSETLLNELNEYFELVEILPFELRGIRLKVLQKLLVNRFFMLNNARALNALYCYYKKHLFAAKEKNCQRLYVKLKKR